MKKTILIFDTEVSGHHIEYLHHLLVKANLSSDKYIFYLPDTFILNKGKELDWSCNRNVEFQYYKNEFKEERSSLLKKSFKKCMLLKSALKKNDVTHVFLLTLIAFLPFIPFFVSKKIKVSGIIYNIYLYRWNSSSFFKKIIDLSKYIILRFSKCIDQIYVLNDAASARYLNYKYKTNKFVHLVDPYVKISMDESITRKILNIPDKSEVFLHMGDMRERKGTLDILLALKKCSINDLYGKTFIFAGKINKEIKKDFYSLINDLPKECHVIVYDQFCAFSFLGSLCNITNYILIPYKQTGQSTGIIGYAAQFMKPVLGPSSGLVGKLIKKYQLGYTLDSINADSIYEFIVLKDKTKIITKEYLSVSSVENFIQTICFE